MSMSDILAALLFLLVPLRHSKADRSNNNNNNNNNSNNNDDDDNNNNNSHEKL